MHTALSPTVDEQLVSSAGGRLYVKSWCMAGSAAPIVLMHDSIGCVALWRDFPVALAQATGRTVLAYDRLGFGQSDPHPGLLAEDFIAQEAEHGFRTVSDALGLQDFVVLGHSVGGGMAVNIAARFPERCRAVITEAAQAFVEDRTTAGIRDARTQFALPGQVDRLGKYHGDKAAWALSSWIDTWLSPSFSSWNLDCALAGLRCPLLAIHGEDDEYGSMAHPARMARLSGAPVTTLALPGCGHVPHREQPESVLQAIAGFLAANVGERKDQAVSDAAPSNQSSSRAFT